jgi:phosphoribosyl 1,2-cyclic phosphate phosphodiesterase
MKIKILGTAAADGWPALFCRCSACQKARELGGKNIRSRSSILIYLFITHAHYDHYDPLDLAMRKYPCTLTPFPLLRIYGNSLAKKWTSSLLEIIQKGFKENTAKYNFEFQLIEPFKEFQAGKLAVFPLLANHVPNQLCYNYLFSTSQWSFLQAFDTGWYSEETWERLRKITSRRPLDLVIMDCTNGKIETGKKGGHLGVKEIIEMKDSCRFIATHFSHGGCLLHQELEEVLSPEGIEVAFDGMEIEL